MSTPDADHDSAETERASRLETALSDAQRAERAEVADDIARQAATDERIVAALARADDADPQA